MLVEKEIIGPGQYWYTDQQTGLPRKLDVTPEMTKYWHEQGSKMLSAGLQVPVPFEHDFQAHPMTPKEKLLNNAGEVKEYRLKGDVLWGVVDVQDPDAKRKIGHSIRWTSPWINSFTDGSGKKWDNVISHLALTTRPRITKQTPFASVAAALSLATAVEVKPTGAIPTGGICLSKAGRLVRRKKDKRLCPRYPIAFSIMSGAALADDDMPPPKKKPPADDSDDGADDLEIEDVDGGELDAEPAPDDGNIDLEPFNDPAGDVKMEELLADLLSALDIHVEKSGNPEAFKRALYNAAMTKIHELTGKARGDQDGMGGANGQQNGQGNTPPNPLIQQEQQPMYMSLDDINKITDPTMKTIALSMYNENVKLRLEMEGDRKKLNSLNDAKLKEEKTRRDSRIAMLSKVSPRVKADLEKMAAQPSMALSMGEGGAVVDPMAETLAILEKGIGDLPRLLTTDQGALSVQPHPTDGEMSEEESNKLADNMARQMGCPPERKAS